MTEQRSMTVLLVDDHPLMRKGLRTLLGSEADIVVAGEAGDGQAAIAQVKVLAPDVVIMDISMPILNGIEATRRILAEAPETRIIALSIHSEKHFVDAMLGAGACAYILKDSAPEELVHTLHSVMRGDVFMSAPIPGTVISGYWETTGEVPEYSAAAEPILKTKLYRPTLPPDLMPRTHIIERLDAGRLRPLVLVSAPAGYGKSCLISSWLENCGDWPSAWLSLDEDDSNLRQFLSYFLAAVQSAFPQSCEQTQDLVSAPQLPSFPVLMTSLSNDLDTIDRPFILVLDDYHRINIESPVNELLHQLLAHPPIPLHLIIISRRDPPLQLHTLRAQNQIIEVRMQDLCFGLDESRAMLKNITGYTIGDDALTNLQREIEGWAVGLRLVSLTLHRTENRDAFLKNLHGGIQQTQEYLAQEVVSQLSPQMQDWLIKSAILNRYCEPLVQTVCKAETRAGAADRGKFIAAVVAGNLFVIPLDTEDEWFRYHHQFQQLLLHELNRRMAPDEIAGLHLRASEWLERHGMIEEAIQHALKAKDVAGAAVIIEQHQQVELDHDRWYIVEQWLALLPVEVIQQRPRLLLVQAWGLYQKFQMLEIPLLLERVESLLVDETVDETLLGEINFYRGFMLTVFQGDAESALIQFEQARKRLSRLQAPVIAGEVEVLAAVASQMVGEGAQFIRHLDQRIHEMGRGNELILSRLISGPVFIHLLSGNLRAVIPAAQRFTSVCKKSGIANSDSEIWSRYLRANADLQSYHLDEALQGFQYATERRDIVHRKAAIESQVGLVLAYQAMQRTEDAENTMKHLMAFALGTDEPEHIAVAQSCQARLSLLLGDLKSAIDWAQSYDIETHVPSMLMWLEIPLITKIRVMVATGSHEILQQARELLETLRQSTEALRNIYQSIDLLVLQSLTLAKIERTDEALDVLQQAIKLAEPGNWVRPFIEPGRPMAELLERLADQKGATDYAHLVLDRFPAHEQQLASTASEASRASAGSGAWSAKPLTRRELDVLELLAQRLQTKEIATRLFVSPETIKSHLKHLYQKLDIHDRREASIKAAEIVSRKCKA